MQKKILLLATFVNPEQLDKTLINLYKKFGVNKKYVFVFETDTEQLLLTYRIFLDFDKKIDIRKELGNTIQIHKKNNTFFTINALNKLIELENNLSEGNIDHSKFNVDWNKFENKIILLKNGSLDILTLKRNNVE
jgi:hypothetical protein